MLFFSIVFLVMISLSYYKVNEVHKSINKNQPQSIDIKDFSTKLKLKVKQVSENYFAIIGKDKKTDHENENHETNIKN